VHRNLDRLAAIRSRAGFRFALAMTVALGLCARAPADLVGPDARFVRGDVDRNGELDITDAIVILQYLFLGGSGVDCPDAADVDDGGSVDIADPVRLLDFLFRGGTEPPAPFPEPALDPTDDDQTCEGCGEAPPLPTPEPCGRPGLPCAVAEDVIVDPDVRFRNDAPSIALDASGRPHIVYSVAEGGYHGRYAHVTDDGTWNVGAMLEAGTDESVPLATGSVVVDPRGVPVALVYDGAFGLSMWTPTEADGWERCETLGIRGLGWHGGLLGTTRGCLVATIRREEDVAADTMPAIGVRTESWDFVPIAGAGYPIGLTLALAPSGRAHVAFWEAFGADGFHLRWSDAAGAAETVVPGGMRTLRHREIELAMRGEDDPAFLMRRGDAELLDRKHRLELVTRDADGAWSAVTIAEDDPEPLVRETCGEPFDGGEPCTYEYTTWAGLGLVANADGELRAVYARRHWRVELAPACFPPSNCEWQGTTTVEGELWIASVDASGEVSRQRVVEDFRAAAASVVLDDAGDLHIAAYEWSPDASGSRLRYVRMASTP